MSELRIDPSTYTHGAVAVSKIPRRVRIIAEYDDEIVQFDLEQTDSPISFRYGNDGSNRYIARDNVLPTFGEGDYSTLMREEKSYVFSFQGEARFITVKNISKIEPED